MEKITRSCPASFTIDKIGRIQNYTSKKKEIRVELINMTNYHCAYCDCLLRLSDYTPHIEHYKPKAEEYYPNLEKVWHNLFSSCPKCNEIKNGYPKIKPLKPDTNEFLSFEKWFEIDFEKYEIRANKFLSNNDKERAKATINWLGLNDYERIKARKNEYNNYQKNSDKNIENYSYRFFIKTMLKLDNDINK